MPNRSNRREFLKTAAAAAGAGYFVATRGGVAFGDPQQAQEEAAKTVAASEKLNVACVGVSGRGADNLNGVAANKSVNIVAVCDVDENNVNGAAMKFPKAQKYRDFRKMLEQKDIDAVVVATPDHTHFHAGYHAILSGRHLYCEKPMTHDVWECRTLTEAALKNKRVTQMGTQIHAEANYRRVVELIQAGAIGKVKEVHTFMGNRWAAPDGRPTTEQPVPKHIDYDLWVGPAELYPYHPAYLPGNWRSFWNFGNGTLGDMACHHMDLPFWALGLKYPTKITPVAGQKPNPDGAPEWLTVRWDFPADGDRPAVNLFWWQESGEPTKPEGYDDWSPPQWFGAGNAFVGEKGVLFADYGQLALRPEKDFKDYQRPPESIPPSIGHHNEWIEACKKGDPLAPLCNFSYSGPLTETVLLGCAAYRAQTALDWDAANLKVTNTQAADKFLRRDYRKGWEVPATA